jgi:predicted permease
MRVRLRLEQLQRLLAESPLSQNHWAMRLGLSRGHWSDIVNGRHPYPSPKTRQRMLEELGVPLEQLFEIESGPTSWSDIDFRAAIADRYLIDRELGQGGMGAVFLARDIARGRQVALKVVSPEAVSGIGTMAFMREISFIAQLNHPHILPLFDSGVVAEHPFYVMPWMRDGSLRERLRRDTRLDVRTVLAISKGIASALSYAHERSILHCDVKPENVLLHGDHAYVMDFGISRALHAEFSPWRKRNELDVSAGTPAYVSPEQANGDADLDDRADVYSMACVLYELLTGRAPFEGQDTRAVISRRFLSPPPPVREYAPEISEPVADWVQQAMALDRNRRPSTPAEFQAGLEAAADRRPTALASFVLGASRGIGRVRRRFGRAPATRLGAFWQAAVQDTRYALRGLRLRPAFTAMVVVTLALGIGANATMFGILDRLLFRAPAHIVDPDRVVVVHSRRPASPFVQTSQPYVVYKDFQAQVADFQSVAVVTPSSVVSREYYPLGRGAGATRVAGAQVSPDYFPLLGVKPALGRFFQEDEAGERNPQRLAVIGYEFWQRHFGGERSVIGRTLELGADPYTVVGVAPRGFTGTELSDVDVWIPIAAAGGLRFAKGADWAATRNSQWLSIVARLKPGVSLEHARAQATAAIRAGERIHAAASGPRYRGDPDSIEAVLSSVIPGRGVRAFGLSSTSGELRVSRLLGAVSFLVLLIACANVANLLLARALNRRREIAVRLALGISRRRLVGQLLLEGVLLAGLGALGALLCAQLASGFIRSLLLGESAWSGSAVDARVLLFTAVVASGTGLLASLLPALQASRPELTSALKAGVREGSVARSRTRTVLLAAQAALAVVMLAGAGLFVKSMWKVSQLPLGVDIDRVLVASIAHSSAGMSNAEAREMFRRFTERAHSVPGISAAATSVGLSFGMGWGVTLSVPGKEKPEVQNNPSQYAVTPEYFDVLGIRLLNGRLFTDADRIGTAPVAIINETTAKTFWPGENPIGQCVTIGADTMPCTTVIGIVTNARRQQLVEGPVSQIYRPLDQVPASETDRSVSFFGYAFIARATRSPASLVEPLRRMMQSTAPNVPYAEVRPLKTRLDRFTRSWKLGATMFSIFGALALVVAAVGLYSVVAFTIAQRRHEFGVRVALGATGGNLLRLTVLRGVMPAAFGILIGLVLARLGGRLVAGMLFQLSPRDPFVLGAASAALFLAAVLASVIPGLRVTKVDPIEAMRAE